ncbi:MAG TPA: TetR family transcriptional regulator [Polyangiaceae bacterium]
MKVSKEKRDETRRALVQAAVALFVEQGFADTSIREIAARANVAPGTAYKYFPDREQLVRAFFELRFADAEASLDDLPNFATFTLKEKLHAFVEALLEAYLPDREFVAIAIRNLVDAPLQSFGSMQPVRHQLVAVVEGMLERAVAGGEFAPPLQRGFLTNVFWDYTILVVLYWLSDDSESFAKTSEFIDKSLDIYVTLVQSGIVDKAARLLMFLLKNHLYANFEHITSLLGAMSEIRLSGFGRHT